ncbi:MAG: hypothetical protein J1E34_07875 [Oscillospiraceae bacterium]|nr:hypothetical protein [Oscillospiraceae bacterium]
MKTGNNIIKSYLTDVSSELLCDKKEKRAILNSLREDAEEYALGKETITRSELEDLFGSPESIAGNVILNNNAGFIKRKLTLKRAVLFALIAALVIWAAFIIISLIDVHTEAYGYIEEGLLAANNSIGRFISL